MNAPTAGPDKRPLLITIRPYPGKDWADIATSAGAGLRLWRERRHAIVFADLGDLGNGISGARLSRVLRAESPTVRIYLLSDMAGESHRLWGTRSGADDVIPRQAEAIAACLSPIDAGPRVGAPPQPESLLLALAGRVRGDRRQAGFLRRFALDEH